MHPRPLLAGLATIALAAGLGAQPSLRRTFDGLAPSEFQGVSVSVAGDIDQDGRADFVVGASGHAAPLAFMGIARIYSGRTGALLDSITGSAMLDEMGYAVSDAGDVNLDGYPDVLVGAIGENGNGAASGSCRVLSGEWIAKTAAAQTPATPRLLHTFFGDGPGDNLGLVVTRAGDIDLDGHEDILVGAPRDDDNGSSCGSICVYSGATGAVLATFQGDAAGDQLGHAAAGVGDLNGDGWPEIAAGAFGADIPFVSAGMVRIYSGEWIARTAAGLVPLTPSVMATVRGAGASHRFGMWVACAGDPNQDSVPDVVVGAPNASFAGAGSGSVYVLSGEWIASTAAMVAPVTPQVLQRFDGGAPGDNLGTTCGGAVDMDGDGVADVFGGAPLADPGGPSRGRVTVWSGASWSVIAHWDGVSDGEQFGLQVKAAGDTEWDGFGEIVIGAPFAMPSGVDSGRVEVRSAAAGVVYGDGLGGLHTLSLEWLPGTAPTVHQGLVHIGNGAPGGTVVVLVSALPDDLQVLPGLHALVSLSAGYVGFFEVVLPASGEVHLPVDLKDPGLAGVGFYVQAAQTVPALAASSGLLLLFAP